MEDENENEKLKSKKILKNELKYYSFFIIKMN